MIALVLALSVVGSATIHASDAQPAVDLQRPVSEVRRDGFTVQYWTSQPCATKVELRQSDLPRNTLGHVAEGNVSEVVLDAKSTQWHIAKLTKLQPGKRYYYRVFDPGAVPTSEEARWGASNGWRREFACSTLATSRKKTIIHLPVKVLLMPNVVNLESGMADFDGPAPLPPLMTDAELAKIKSEYAVSSRLLWVASGMRLWVDYQIVVDPRRQVWGPEPEGASKEYKGLPVCRMYNGKDFDPPGGGTWTFVDAKNPEVVHKDPFTEAEPYCGQIEQAFPRRWNLRTKKWDFYTSGGGTFGIDDWAKGVPTRSNFLGGGDTAWLATHEFHHGMESFGHLSLSNREDDRIVYDHPSPRYRKNKGDGSFDENTWSTSGLHGEHWDVIAWWDRQITDPQWLRLMFGRTEVVTDADEDGFPDNDPRLPLDEKRFGSSPSKKMTDGEISDLNKVMLSTWAPGPLQPTWVKTGNTGVHPNPKSADSDGDGILDRYDPYPLSPNTPLIPFTRPKMDGSGEGWTGVPIAGQVNLPKLKVTFKQAHDEAAYYGQLLIEGDWQSIDTSFDGEGKGMFSNEGVLGFSLVNRKPKPGDAQPTGSQVDIKPRWSGAPGLKLVTKSIKGGTVIEFSLPNRGASPWYWKGGGHQIGTSINIFDASGAGYSLWEPYVPFYATMLEEHGKTPIPTNSPAVLRDGEGIVLRPGDPKLKLDAGWKLVNGAYRYSGDDEAAVYLDGLVAKDYDVVAVVEAKADAIIGAYTKATKKLNAGEGYVGFVGGYANTVTKLRIFGTEVGDEPLVMTPGKHTLQLSRRGGEVWFIVDGKPTIYSVDPSPNAIVDRIGVLGGYGGAQTIYEIRYRLGGP